MIADTSIKNERRMPSQPDDGAEFYDRTVQSGLAGATRVDL